MSLLQRVTGLWGILVYSRVISAPYMLNFRTFPSGSYTGSYGCPAYML